LRMVNGSQEYVHVKRFVLRMTSSSSTVPVQMHWKVSPLWQNLQKS